MYSLLTDITTKREEIGLRNNRELTGIVTLAPTRPTDEIPKAVLMKGPPCSSRQRLDCDKVAVAISLPTQLS